MVSVIMSDEEMGYFHALMDKLATARQVHVTKITRAGVVRTAVRAYARTLGVDVKDDDADAVEQA